SMRKCRACLRDLEDSAYQTRKMARGRIALRTRCRECDNAYQRAYSAADPDRKRKYAASHKKRHPEANTQYHRKWAKGPLGRAYYAKPEQKKRIGDYTRSWFKKNTDRRR